MKQITFSSIADIKSRHPAERILEWNGASHSLVATAKTHWTSPSQIRQWSSTYADGEHIEILLPTTTVSLSDPAEEEALYAIESMRRFAQLKLLDDAIPDEITILKFRHMIERHTLSKVIFADINNYLVEKDIQVSQGSMVEATIIQAENSTKDKDKDKKRDTEMHSTRKNNQNLDQRH